MKKQYLGGMAILGVTLLLAACGGGGGGGTTVSGNLAGTWYGNYDQSATARALSVVVGSSNNITSVSIDGADQGLTGTFSLVQNDMYAFSLYAGSTLWDEGGFLVDAADQHAAFLNATGDFGVLEKGGTAATYALSDIVGSWSGYTITLDYLGNLTSYSSSNVTVNGDGSFSGSDSFGSFSNGTLNLSLQSSTYGTYTGNFNSTGAGITNGSVKVWVSHDKGFAAAYACDPTWGSTPYSGLDVCTYSSWVKQ